MTIAAKENRNATGERGEAERIAAVDALRGFALFGILVVNITAFASTYYGSGVPDPNFESPLDNAVRFVVSLFFETKFYLLFSFLFGYSFTLQMQSAERAGEPLVPRMLRRLAGLWLIGALHAVLLFQGDILTTYAVLGLFLLWWRGRSDSFALRTACWLTGVTAVVWGVVGVLTIAFPDEAELTQAVDAANQALAAYRGSIATVIGQHIEELKYVWVVIALVQGPCALAMFLVGLVAGRARLLARPEALRPWIRRLLPLGLLIGLPGALAYASGTVYLAGGLDIVGLSLSLVTGPFLTGAYVALVMLALGSGAGSALVGLLAPAGRMALSNYLLQSLVCAFIFTAYGLRLIGTLSPLAVFGVALAIFASQLVVSRLWLNVFAYGPLEWLLRAFTIGTWPRWRRAPGSVERSP